MIKTLKLISLSSVVHTGKTRLVGMFSNSRAQMPNPICAMAFDFHFLNILIEMLKQR